MPKSKTLTGYLIDPYANSVTEVEVKGDYKALYPLIDCDTFVIACRQDNGDGIFVDDNGLLTMTEHSRFFTFEGCHSPLVGKGLMLGCNAQGDSTNPKTPLAVVKSKIKFFSLDEVRRTL